jgi:hypothetical protein
MAERLLLCRLHLFFVIAAIGGHLTMDLRMDATPSMYKVNNTIQFLLCTESQVGSPNRWLNALMSFHSIAQMDRLNHFEMLNSKMFVVTNLSPSHRVSHVIAFLLE